MEKNVSVAVSAGAAGSAQTRFAEASQEVSFCDALFRRQRKRGFELVPSPNPSLEAPVADSHAHLDLMADPALSLARCAVMGMDFICTVAEPAEDGAAVYENLPEWLAGAMRLLPDVFEGTRRALGEHRADMAAAGTPLPEAPTSDEMLSYRCGCTASIPRVRVAVGVHPHNAKSWDADMEQLLRSLLAKPATCALGEVGLDYHYDLSPRDVQRDVFRRQVAIAHECGLPLILHVRDAHEDAFAIMEEEGWPAAGTLLHCCSVGPDELARWIDRGCYVAFGGAVTFKSSDDLRASSVTVPTGRLLAETDSPYMAPVPFRGQECGPEFTVFVAEHLAKLRGLEPGEPRRAFLQDVHDATLELLDREPTAWQQCAAFEESAGLSPEPSAARFEEWSCRCR